MLSTSPQPSRRWRLPSLTVASVVTSNTDASFSIIPSASTAKLSIRYVPKQSEKRVQEVVEAHLRHEFAKLNSPNEVGQLCRGWLALDCC